MKTVLHCAICLCASLLLIACGATQQQAVRTELIEVPTILYAPLPSALTEPLAPPPAPPKNCTLRDAMPAVCAFDALLWIVQWDELLQRINDDRATAGKLTRDAAGQSLSGRDGEARP